MKDICEATKLSRGGLYCHYESTRQIFQEIIDDMTGQQENVVDFKIRQNQSAIFHQFYENKNTFLNPCDVIETLPDFPEVCITTFSESIIKDFVENNMEASASLAVAKFRLWFDDF